MQVLKYIRAILFFLRSFFPLQLLFGHLKYNLFALSFWAYLFLIITDRLGFSYGIPFLFYSPEYNGSIGDISFALIGFSIGGFTMAFNTYSYMKIGKKYPFLATLSRPFLRFCLNNMIIPVVFNIFFIWRFTEFQHTEEFADTPQVYGYIFSYIGGFILFVLISMLYFFPINKHVYKILGTPLVDKNNENETQDSIFHNKIVWNDYFSYQKDREYIYLSSLSQWKRSRSTKHYDKELLKKVFARTRINSSFFEIVTIISFIVLGLFRNSPFFEVPAAMSLVMLFTIILMFFSALRSWFGYWTGAVVIGVLVLLNYLSLNSNWFQYTSYGYGINYAEEKKVPFTLESITERNMEEAKVTAAKENYIQLLETWKRKTGRKKPKLILMMTSGGGSRSAMWTFTVLQNVDQKLNGDLMKHIHLMTGASGGLIGAAYYRSLVMKDFRDHTTIRFQSKHQQNISKDLLNKLIFSAYSNDLFYRERMTIGKNRYTKDRGYAFELQLNTNTENHMNYPLGYYKKFEDSAAIPTMVFTPTIVDNGRRLLVGTRPLSFLCATKRARNGWMSSFENVDYQSFFDQNNPQNLRFSSLMRMSATFPFVLPMVTLPTTPSMHVMDAGLRDNYGGKLTMEFMYAMRHWIKKNTSGVIVLQVRDTKKMLKGDVVKRVSLFKKFTLPFGNMYDNFPRTQDYDQEEMMKVGTYKIGYPVNFISFNLLEEQKKRVSLSWHLTSQEKARVRKAIYSRGNKYALYELNRVLRDSK